MAQSSAGRYMRNLRRLTSGWRFEAPEVGRFASVFLRRFAEVFEATSGGLAEVVYGVKYGEFSVVQIFCRRFCGVFRLQAPDVRKTVTPCQAYIPGCLRGFEFVASGASAILKIKILSRV